MPAAVEEKTMRQAALDLVNYGVQDDPDVLKAYWFSSEAEIRLLYVDSTTNPLHLGEAVAPYHFGSNHAENRPYRSAIAVIRPEEEGIAPLPPSWGQ